MFWAIIDWPFKIVSLVLIETYRHTFSLLVGRQCRHAPSCSEYTRDAIMTHGFWPGGWMGLSRIVRCGPRGTHGYDPVPEGKPDGARWFMPWTYGRWR